MTRKRLADLVGVASSTVDNIVGMASDIHVIVKDRHATIVGLPGQTYEPPQRYTPTALRMAEYLRQHGVSTAVEIVNGTGTNARHAPRVLQRYRDDLFRVVDVSRTQYGRPKYHWDVIRSD